MGLKEPESSTAYAKEKLKINLRIRCATISLKFLQTCNKIL